MTPLECPCAESTVIISTPASTKASTLLRVSVPIPTAAPTLNLPFLSLQALG
jgi:hypothetical protein